MRPRTVLVLAALLAASSASPPHIVFIIADDLGWNDVGFHGMNHVPTPNIDALAWAGIVLHKYYTPSLCTPSRAALMTGKYPIHTGMQHDVILAQQPWGLPLTEKIFPQYMKELGYKTHLVGKWHLGYHKKEYLPTYRGFDSHLGFWTGKIDMYDHTNNGSQTWGTDFRRGMHVANDYFGKYATDVYSDEAVDIIAAHNASAPLFLVVSHSAVHSGNGPEYLRAPDDKIASFNNITDYQRQKFAGILSKLDDSVGEVVAALSDKGLLNNSVIVFTTDNGGAPMGQDNNRASNYPLRGAKNTLWEGGTRGAGLLWSPLLANTSRVATQRMHMIDWLPTLYSVAGGNVSALDIDGIDQWSALSNNTTSNRTTILYNIDIVNNTAAIAVGDWKYISGATYKGKWDSWFGPAGREGSYNTTLVLTSPAALAIANYTTLPTAATITTLRSEATVTCNVTTTTTCSPLTSPCLFDLSTDPCELNNVYDTYPSIVTNLTAQLTAFNETALTPRNIKRDPRGDPKWWGRVVTNFADYVAEL